MNPALKQRLVGAVVLVALAVIFLPMLLDGSGAREQLDEEISIPDKPEAPESHLEPLEPRAGEQAADGAGDADSPGVEDGSAEPPGEEAGRTDGGGEPAADAPREEAKDGAGSAAAPDPDGRAGDAGVESGWIVQVGSFRRETNALVLRDRLRQEGFDASSERAQADGRTVWRVLVGPVAARSEGESLKQRLESLRGETALLMAYP